MEDSIHKGFIVDDWTISPTEGVLSRGEEVVRLEPKVMEVLVYFIKSRRLRAWRPLWIGFPIGFVGTLGVYYTAAASI